MKTKLESEVHFILGISLWLGSSIFILDYISHRTLILGNQKQIAISSTQCNIMKIITVH